MYWTPRGEFQLDNTYPVRYSWTEQNLEMLLRLKTVNITIYMFNFLGYSINPTLIGNNFGQNEILDPATNGAIIEVQFRNPDLGTKKIQEGYSGILDTVSKRSSNEFIRIQDSPSKRNTGGFIRILDPAYVPAFFIP